MLILSQDNEKVIKRIINFDNIIYLSINKINIKYTVIIFKDSTMDDNKLKDYNCVLGVYDTEERAKEVLQEIIERYDVLKKNTTYAQGDSGFTFNEHYYYEMPEK